MHKSYMRWLFLTLCLLVITGMGLPTAKAATYTLSDGRQFSGDPITIKEDGVIIKSASDSYSPRIPLESFTQESLKALLESASSDSQKQLIAQFIQEPAQDKAKRKEVAIKPITPPARPDAKGLSAILSSPLGLVIFLVLYGGTVFAGYEVAIYRDRPIGLVCGLSALPLIGIASPIAFMLIKPGVLPSAPPKGEEVGEPAPVGVTTELAAVSDELVPPGSGADLVTQVPAQPKLPKPIVFQRGEFSFNRRFFETKLANFQRIIPSPADKDMVVWIKSARGEFTGRRITQINPENLHLQVFKADATADEMIPFSEILEVQIRHKDIA